MYSAKSIFILIVTIAFCVTLAEAQTKRRTKTSKKPTSTTAIAPAPSPVPEEPAVVTKPESKKNERPASVAGEPVAAKPIAIDLAYYYEFAQPEFTISKLVIEHDDSGRGKITFTKKEFDDTVTDPVQVSAAALERINAAYTALNFLDSNVNYQYEKDYSHLGNATFRLRKGTKERTTKFNYTLDKNARALADEYRRVGNQAVWIFDITVARENQPLDAPRLLDSLDALIKRGEISDPVQMVPMLKELSNDERVPLIARNHASKLAEKIEKGKK